MPVGAGVYVPTLAIRASEMNGLEFLPARSKDSMLPCFLLAPWSSARSLERAMERLERAYSHRPYFLDVDRDYFPSNPDNPAQTEWLGLRDPSDRYDNWWQFWTDYPNAIPCLQLEGQTPEEIRLQIGDVQSQGREFCVRIELQRRPRNISQIVDVLQDVGTADYSVILEGGWVTDPLSMYVQFHALITGVLAPLDGRIPIVASCTSMPKGYHELPGGVSEIPFSNRNLVAQLQQNSNRDLIIYGDWGSTRPREDGFGRTPLPRIDYPASNSWFIARDKDQDWDFEDAAAAIVASATWDGDLGIWGEQLIQQTAEGQKFAIDTAPKNVACRVNIHLHRQALFGQDIGGIDLDEPWVDD
jgi:hypothetical protein